MEPKIILIVSRKDSRKDLERTLREALGKECVPHEIFWQETHRAAIDHVNEAGFPDFIVAELDAGDADGGIQLLRHVRHVGRSMPVVIWDSTFTQDEARQIADLNGINVAWHQPRALFRLGRYATTLLHGQRRDQAS